MPVVLSVSTSALQHRALPEKVHLTGMSRRITFTFTSTLLCCSHATHDLFNAIAAGDYPEWDLQIQTMDPQDQLNFDFDPLDATKVQPPAWQSACAHDTCVPVHATKWDTGLEGDGIKRPSGCKACNSHVSGEV